MRITTQLVFILLLIQGLAACGGAEVEGETVLRGELTVNGDGSATFTPDNGSGNTDDGTGDGGNMDDTGSDNNDDSSGSSTPPDDSQDNGDTDTGASGPVDAGERTLTLHRFAQPGQHLVTLGIPFAPGELSSTDQLRILDESGAEVSVYVEPTLTWHFKSAPNNTIRAVKVQFNVNMSDAATSTRTFSFDLNGRNTANDINEAPVEQGLSASPDARKAGVMRPDVMAILSPEWLAHSGLIPPFEPTRNDAHKVYWDAQQQWARDLDYGASTLANWLFDRTTAMYKGCMRNGNAECYREAFTSFRYWANNLKRDGTAGGTSCRGGPTMGSIYKICDGKYVYLENFKLHWALTGDDSLFDDQFLADIATTSWSSWQAIPVREARDDQDDFFTERGAGITLLTQVNAYELLGHAEILDRIETGLDILYGMQNNPLDGYAADGSWRHSWDEHEGAENYATGDMDDRRFSPWMSENLVDGLWQANQVVNDSRIGEMIRKMAGALEQWGFPDSPGYINKYGMDLVEYRELATGYNGWNHGCNDGTLVMYTGSSVASAEALIDTNVSDGYYSDMHNPETVLILTLGYHFESDSSKKSAYLARINDIRDNFFNTYCASVDSTKRLFNWQNRSNAWGTHLWVMDN